MRKAITLLVIAITTVLVCILVLPAQADPPVPEIVKRAAAFTPRQYAEILRRGPWSPIIMSALQDWSPHSSVRPQSELMQPWADAMGDVCMSRSECVHMAALAFMESGFVSWVLFQECNSQLWRAEHQMQKVCDNGYAYGPWQVHNSRFAGASPEFQASVVLELIRHYPQGWTTWSRANALADRWLAAHP